MTLAINLKSSTMFALKHTIPHHLKNRLHRLSRASLLNIFQPSQQRTVSSPTLEATIQTNHKNIEDWACLLLKAHNTAIDLTISRADDGFFTIHCLDNGLKAIRELSSQREVVMTVQRGGHGWGAVTLANELRQHGLESVIHGPVALGSSHLEVRCDYLNEKGYAPDWQNFPTDPQANKALSSLVELISRNPQLFFDLCTAKVLFNDCKAEAGMLATAVARGINPNLKIISFIVNLFDIPADIQAQLAEKLPTQPAIAHFLDKVGLGSYGIPDFLQFMAEKARATIRIQNDAISSQQKNGVLVHSTAYAPCNTKRPPQIGLASHGQISAMPLIASRPEIEALPTKEVCRQAVAQKIGKPLPPDQPLVLIKLPSNPDLEPNRVQRIVQQLGGLNAKRSTILVMGALSAAEKAWLKESDVIPLGFIKNRQALFQTMKAADLLITPGGSINSPLEALHLLRHDPEADFIPLFIEPTTQPTLERVAPHWQQTCPDSPQALFHDKVLPNMITIETLPERWINFLSLAARNALIQQFSLCLNTDALDEAQRLCLNRALQDKQARSEILADFRQMELRVSDHAPIVNIILAHMAEYSVSQVF